MGSDYFLLFVAIVKIFCQVLSDIFMCTLKFLLPPSFFSKCVTDEKVLITGAGSGIGQLLAQKFAGHGSHLILWDINEAGLEETAKLCRKINPQIEIKTYTLDLSNRDEVYAISEKVIQEFERVDILINNAGIVSGKPLLDASDDMIQKTIDVNISAHFWTVKAFMPGMMDRNHGHIVTIASLAGLFSVNKLADYCASKFAAVGLDESLRYELLSEGINGVKTTVVCPFFIKTGMFAGVKVRYPLITPLLEPEYVVQKIMDAILTDQLMLILPKIGYLFYILKSILPCRSLWYIADHLELTKCMDDFKGRQKTD